MGKGWSCGIYPFEFRYLFPLDFMEWVYLACPLLLGLGSTRSAWLSDHHLQNVCQRSRSYCHNVWVKWIKLLLCVSRVSRICLITHWVFTVTRRFLLRYVIILIAFSRSLENSCVYVRAKYNLVVQAVYKPIHWLYMCPRDWEQESQTSRLLSLCRGLNL